MCAMNIIKRLQQLNNNCITVLCFYKLHLCVMLNYIPLLVLTVAIAFIIIKKLKKSLYCQKNTDVERLQQMSLDSDDAANQST